MMIILLGFAKGLHSLCQNDSQALHSTPNILIPMEFARMIHKANVEMRYSTLGGPQVTLYK